MIKNLKKAKFSATLLHHGRRKVWMTILALCLALPFMLMNNTTAYAADETLILTISKTWENVSTDNIPETITVDIYKSLNVDGSNGIKVDEATLTKTDNWKKMVSLVIDSDTADQYYYFVREKNIPAGFQVSNYSNPIKPTPPTNSNNTVWEDPSTVLPFGSASYYNAVVFGDYEVSGADSEGGLAIQGDFKATGGYTVGIPAAANQSWWNAGWSSAHDVGKKIYPHNPRFVVGGNVDYFNNLHSVGGKMLVSNNTQINGTGVASINEWEFLGAGAYSSSNAQSEFQKTNHVAPYQNIARDSVWIQDFFNKAQLSLTSLSNEWRDLQTTSKIYSSDVALPPIAGTNNELTFTMPANYQDYDYIVYHVKAIESTIAGVPTVVGESSFSNVKMDFPGDYAGKVIINMIPQAGVDKMKVMNGTIEFNNVAYTNNKDKEIYENARKYSSRIFWNFPESTDGSKITKLTMSGSQFIGAILAPYSNLVAQSGGINGNAVLKSVSSTQSSGFEFHNTGFDLLAPSLEEEYSATLSLTNTYSGVAASTPASLNGVKVFENGKLKGNDFAFELRNKMNNELIERVKNNADGSFAFSPLVFNNVGTYEYRVFEVGGDDHSIEYDNEIYDVRIVVSENSDATLKTTTTIQGQNRSEDTLKFINKKIITSKPSLITSAPQTGVRNSIMHFAILLIMSLCGFVFDVRLRKNTTI